MGCGSSKGNTGRESTIRTVANCMHVSSVASSNEGLLNLQQNTRVDEATLTKLIGLNDQMRIEVSDSEAFNTQIVQRRQEAIDNHVYRTTIDSWQPKSLQQLAEMVKSFSNGKSMIDRHWIIFYWIACNIEYDTVAFFAKNFKNQFAEAVFRAKKGVCAGFGNLYKYLSDQLEMPCQIIGGYSKGYGFDNREEEEPVETDHGWNAVEIDNHWYLMECTWGAGHLNKQKTFERKLNAYYFLPRPDEMIYHHFPEDEKWQLLRTPISMAQYLQMPKVHSTYFQLKLELVSPRNQPHVDFLPNKPYALVVIRAPSNVHLIADLKLNDQVVEGGHQIVFDDRKQLYCCYFAPLTIGKHKITVYGKQHGEVYSAVINLIFNVKDLPPNPISFPELWENFSILGLEIVFPVDTHRIKLNSGLNYTEIRIRAPKHVEISGRLENQQKEEVDNADQVYYDRRNDIWRCRFAPDRAGNFNALILAKKTSDPGNYTSAVSFEIEAQQISSPPLSYPKTWQLFHDLGLRIAAPKNRANAVWPENASYAEVLIQAPNDVILSCDIKYNDMEIENGSLAQFDSEKNLWQLLFAPQRTGSHDLIVYAKRGDDSKASSGAVVKFNLDVPKLQQPMKFPLIYTEFESRKCRLHTPLDGILKKNAVISILCFIPGATDVDIKVDSNWLDSEGYADSVLQRQITVGSKEVTIYAKYGEDEDYDALIKYSVR